MEKESKFGYGFLLVGASLPYLIEHLFGATSALVVTLICAVAGVVFLSLAHIHQPPGQAPISKKRKVATVLLAVAIIVSVLKATWTVYAESRHVQRSVAPQLVPQDRQQSSPNSANSLSASSGRSPTKARVRSKPSTLRDNKQGGDGSCQANAVGGNAIIENSCNTAPPKLVLTEAQLADIKTRMQAFRGLPVLVIVEGETPSTRSVAENLNQALKDAGLSSSLASVAPYGYSSPEGISIVTNPSAQEAMRTLVSYLESTKVVHGHIPIIVNNKRETEISITPYR